VGGVRPERRYPLRFVVTSAVVLGTTFIDGGSLATWGFLHIPPKRYIPEPYPVVAVGAEDSSLR
jgi:hypothetical protein